MKHSRKIIAAITVIALLGVATWVARSGSEPGVDAAHPGAPKSAPSFELKDLSGKVHRLQDFQGHPVIIHFWAGWCPPCLGEISEWIEFAKKLQGKPIQMIAISLDKNWEDAQKILPEKNLPTNVISLLDTEARVADQFGSYQYPETYVLNSRHEIVVKLVGAQRWSTPEFSDRLLEILMR